MPLVADHKCSSPEVYGADISPNMLCAGYFDCKTDACQVSPSLAQPGEGLRPQGQQGPGQRAHLRSLREGPSVGHTDGETEAQGRAGHKAGHVPAIQMRAGPFL